MKSATLSMIDSQVIEDVSGCFHLPRSGGNVIGDFMPLCYLEQMSGLECFFFFFFAGRSLIQPLVASKAPPYAVGITSLDAHSLPRHRRIVMTSNCGIRPPPAKVFDPQKAKLVLCQLQQGFVSINFIHLSQPMFRSSARLLYSFVFQISILSSAAFNMNLSRSSSSVAALSPFSCST